MTTQHKNQNHFNRILANCSSKNHHFRYLKGWEAIGVDWLKLTLIIDKIKNMKNYQLGTDKDSQKHRKVHNAKRNVFQRIDKRNIKQLKRLLKIAISESARTLNIIINYYLDSQKVKKKHSQTVDGTKSCQLALMFKNMSIFVVLSFHLQFL